MGKQTKPTTTEVEHKTEQKVEKKSHKSQEEKSETVQQTTQSTPTTQTEDRFDEHLKNVELSYSEAKKLLHSLHTNIKKLQAVHKSELKRAKVKRSKRSEKHKPTGFARLRPVSGKMAEFINVESGTELSGPAITAKVWSVLKSRGLTYKGDESKGVKGDQRVLRADKEVSELFFVPMTVNKSTKPDDEDGFNFGNLQFYIKQAMEGKKLEKKPRKQKEETTDSAKETTESTKKSETSKKSETEQKTSKKTLTK
jgi:hypothetical protein